MTNLAEEPNELLYKAKEISTEQLIWLLAAVGFDKNLRVLCDLYDTNFKFRLIRKDELSSLKNELAIIAFELQRRKTDHAFKKTVAKIINAFVPKLYDVNDQFLDNIEDNLSDWVEAIVLKKIKDKSEDIAIGCSTRALGDFIRLDLNSDTTVDYRDALTQKLKSSISADLTFYFNSLHGTLLQKAIDVITEIVLNNHYQELMPLLDQEDIDPNVLKTKLERFFQNFSDQSQIKSPKKIQHQHGLLETPEEKTRQMELHKRREAEEITNEYVAFIIEIPELLSIAYEDILLILDTLKSVSPKRIFDSHPNRSVEEISHLVFGLEAYLNDRSTDTYEINEFQKRLRSELHSDKKRFKKIASEIASHFVTTDLLDSYMAPSPICRTTFSVR